MRSAMRSALRAARLMAAAVSTGSAAGSGPKRPRPEPPPRIGTHDGTFHCDEVLACYLLRLLPRYRVRPRGTVRRDCGLLGPTCNRAGCLPGPLQRDRDTVQCPDPCPPSRPGSLLGATRRCPVPPRGSPLPGGISRGPESYLGATLRVPSPTWGSLVPHRGHP